MSQRSRERVSPVPTTTDSGSFWLESLQPITPHEKLSNWPRGLILCGETATPWVRMNQAEIICTLLIVVAALAILAKKVELPYPVLLVIGGLALGFVPGLPGL